VIPLDSCRARHERLSLRFRERLGFRGAPQPSLLLAGGAEGPSRPPSPRLLVKGPAAHQEANGASTHEPDLVVTALHRSLQFAVDLDGSVSAGIRVRATVEPVEAGSAVEDVITFQPEEVVTTGARE
jgi:hypothetical protein